MNKSKYEIYLEKAFPNNYQDERLRIIDTIRKNIIHCQRDIKLHNRTISQKQEYILYLKKQLSELHPRRKM